MHDVFYFCSDIAATALVSAAAIPERGAVIRHRRRTVLGADATDMMLDYLRDPQRFASGELGRLATLPVDVERPQR
jgi:hypothetical protein